LSGVLVVVIRILLATCFARDINLLNQQHRLETARTTHINDALSTNHFLEDAAVSST
jgi:hypothetical protein